jgi:hypothetical protein
MMRIDQINQLLGWAEMRLRRHQDRHLMAPPAVERSLLCPCLVTVQDAQPHPLASRLGEIDVGKVTEALAGKTPTVVNEHGVVRVILGRGEGQGAFLDLHREQQAGVWCFDMVLVLAVFLDA